MFDVTEDIIEKIEIEESKEIKELITWKEKDLHPLLTYFANANPSFGRGREIITKTISHERSTKKGYSEWLYPDMVGFHLPIGDWEDKLIELAQLTNNKLIKFYSFELKRTLNKSNYRESYFQAVSNSSWAHEGYLVAAEIKRDDELFSELERLSLSFGIGIIHIDLRDIDSSSILFPTIPKINLDWETMNKLCAQNNDFKEFIKDIKGDLESKIIHRSEYDEVIKDPNDYIKSKFSI